ncbi:transcriptional regulator BetI [Photobacterium angustum]|uniref:HTH-type transcriptional regulator BetI n=1 Tax=Photobacterium angustum TaxID=661 RepID=A0A855SF23_PHOAN|nr:transcriptional regulator BetI [Photobacterium angustum]KJF83300.1 BetI family transcriptional regulator [Photobacterium damselae subsp. damselae]KJG32072.1 BetI family transcriptional regulator [Photobacterium angustum]KJG42850.1 BetI family transcriptional regulator [Photobacterium angustum]KJG47608.1 BetI family transcriptional regulator [Photobacterium angustum]KJG50148.1 BetI family transcriptional regulator [Photobacterium angustum]
MPKVGMPDIRKPQLVNATMAVIERVGLHAASISLISKEAGVSTGIINHYFGGKHGLLEETMREILRRLSMSVTTSLSQIPLNDHQGRINAIIMSNFDGYQAENKVAKTWLAFWSYAMHDKQLGRLQQVNEKRLLSHLKIELKGLLPFSQAELVAHGIASLIDGIWLRGTLNPKGIDANNARMIINDYLEKQLAFYSKL